MPEDVDFRYRVAAEYTLGLCWVLRYYYQGCSSWKWYFPYHYAPFASDFINIDAVANEFEKGTKPFAPLEQLMSVFPAASRSHVPEPWGELMIDPDCEIIDFYPEDFKIDLNGKKYAWQGVALLPFVDEDRLKNTLKSVYPKLTEEEKRRNKLGDDRLYIRDCHAGFNLLHSIFTEDFDKEQEVQLDAKLFEGMSGRVLFSSDCIETDSTFPSPVKGLVPVHGNRVLCVRYRDLKFDPDFIFPAKRLPGAQDPPCVLRPEDLIERSSNFTPRMGFGPRTNQASLGRAGHRMLNHHNPGRGRGPAPFGNVPPPVHGQMMAQQERRYDNQHRGGYNGGRDNYGRDSYRDNYGHNSRGGSQYDNRNQASPWQKNREPWHQRGGHQGGRGGGGYDRHQGGGGYDRNQRGGFDRNQRGGYDRNQRGGYDRNGGNRGGYQQRGGGDHHQQRRGGGRDGSSGGGYGYYTSSYQGGGRR